MTRRRSLRKLGLCLALVTPMALTTSTHVTLARADAAADAREHFKAGVRHLQDPEGARYEDAYREFLAAYAATPNPKILGNIGLCAMKLERDGESIAAYGRYLAEVPDIDPEERDQIGKDLQAMRSGVAHISVDVAPGTGAVTVIDTRTPVTGAPIVNTYGPLATKTEIGLRPGHHVLRVRTPAGDESGPWEIDAKPGSIETHVFSVAKPEPTTKKSSGEAPVHVEPASSRIVPWVLTGVGGAMLLGAATTGFVVMKKVQSLDSRCPNDTCAAGSNLDGDRDSAKRWMRATDVLLIGGGVLAGTGVLWLLFADAPHDEAPPKDAARARPDFACSGAGCTFSLSGSF